MTTERYHGTIGGYWNHRCRCEPCRAAASDYNRLHRSGNPHNGRVQATCWCEARTVWIPAAWVGERTASCGAAGCEQPEREDDER